MLGNNKETSSSTLDDSLHPMPPSRSRRHLTLRRLLILLPPTILLLFSVTFFPAYFTSRNYHTTSTASSTNATALQTAASLTKVGAVWKQKQNFKDLSDFRIEYYSSGQNNSEVLTGGLPAFVWRSAKTEAKVRRGKRGGMGSVGGRGRCEVKGTGGREKVGKEKGSGKANGSEKKGGTDKGKGKGRKERCQLKRQDSSSSSSSTSRTSTRSSSSTTSSSPSTTSSTKTSSHIASSSSTIASSTTTPATSSPTPTPGSVLSILYPAHSYTPSALPVGGTQFYALTPFDLSLVSSLTLNYSVFFPASFDFVLGGKLPGLYGGTEGCGGGNSASDCWSTRMAWRTDGVGELYAYLPQDKQNTTAMLAVPPYSYVNSDYGISLGRGALNYTRGAWTSISQTVTLQSNESARDGVVEVSVDGVKVISYDQVYWPTGVKGILFSTFFGGSTVDWATPVDQYSFFKDFSVRINALK